MRLCVEIPVSLGWVADEPGGREWLEGVPGLVAELGARWSVALEGGFMESSQALVMPGVRVDGHGGSEPVVLKIRPPMGMGGEGELEAAALAEMDGVGVVRLLAEDAGRCALLVERCVPGTPLAQCPDEAVAVVGAILARQWRPAVARFPTLAERATRWEESLPGLWEERGRPLEKELLEAAVGYLRELARSQGEEVLINEDVHGDNVLRAGREPWLVIDPDPLIGEREFAIASVVRCPEFGHSEAQVRRRHDRLVAELGLDWERARGWGVAHAIARAFLGDPVKPHCVEVARWLLQA